VRSYLRTGFRTTESCQSVAARSLRRVFRAYNHTAGSLPIVVGVAQIEFTEWTPDGHLRHSSFAGLKNDKEAREVRRE
jgi:ATP-dependent DNA ligase